MGRVLESAAGRGILSSCGCCAYVKCMAVKVICLNQNGFQVFLEPEMHNGVIGIVCEEWASEM